MIADRIGGNANIASHTRMTIASNSPRRAAAATPSAVPIVMPTMTDKAEIDSELKAPAISIDSTSRPRWSVPKQAARQRLLQLLQDAQPVRVLRRPHQCEQGDGDEDEGDGSPRHQPQVAGEPCARRNLDRRCRGLRHALARRRGSSTR